jgi:hypothetical protein
MTMRNVKRLYAVELDVSQEAGRPNYWVIHDEGEGGSPGLCVYESKREANARSKFTDHQSRVVTFERVDPKPRKRAP